MLGTDLFFCVVGRAALARASDSVLVKTMGRFHDVADRRVPKFGVIGSIGTLANIAFSRVSLWLGAERRRRAGAADRRLSKRSGAAARSD
jgi:hypothetical protein